MERSSNVRRFDALQSVPGSDRRLVEALIRPLEPTTSFFYAQREEGFYGGLTAVDVLPEFGDSPYTIIRANGVHKAYRYHEIDPYKGYLREISRRMEDASGVANDTGDPQRYLFETTLRPRAAAIRKGDFADVMILGLNAHKLPRYHLFIGLLDRYLDPRGLKLAMQGWLQQIDPEQDAYFNNIAAQITGSDSLHTPKLRVIYGDMLAAGGLTTERPWAGNTLPSEDDLRDQFRADSHIFSNNMDDLAYKEDIPALKRYMPQFIQMTGGEEMFLRAKKAGITAHEAGHALVPFDGKTIGLLGGSYMAIKELLAELRGSTRLGELPRSVLNPHQRLLALARSLTTWRGYIDLYLQETNPDLKAIRRHYAKAGVLRTNYQERQGGVVINGDGTMEVPDWNEFVRLDKNLYYEVLSAITNERHQEGFVDAVIQLNSRVPRVYMENGNNPPPQPQTVAA